MGSQQHNPYVGMACKQDGGSNQCISICTLIIQQCSKCQCSQALRAAYMDCPSLRFECNCDLSSTLFAGKIDKVECTSCWMPFFGVCAMTTHQLQIRGWHCVTLKQSEKVHKQKKRCRDMWMKLLANKVHNKQESQRKMAMFHTTISLHKWQYIHVYNVVSLGMVCEMQPFTL